MLGKSGVERTLLLCLLLFNALTEASQNNDYKYLRINAENEVCKEGETDIKTVHVVFMNHLDVGFNGIPMIGFVNNVLNTYFHTHFPRALNLSRTLREGGFRERFIYTTHPWLVSLYLKCPPNLILAGVKLKCPSVEEVEDFSKAIMQGDITWHAAPMNMQYEFMSPWQLSFGIKLSDDLDRRFGITRKYKTVSLRDVPGLTQAAIPTLVAAGVAAISVGVNTFSAPPAVPDNLFLWRYGSHEVMATWNKGGYPIPPGPDPEHAGGLSKDHCVIVPGLDHVLCYAFRDDNHGPPDSIQEVFAAYEVLRGEFPEAEVMASTFESFMEAASSVKDTLPVFSQEIGDTWIQGVATDPRKAAEYRTVSRTLDHCLQVDDCMFEDQRFYNASHFFLKLAEHTWGLTTTGDNQNWTNADFRKAEKDPVTGPLYMNATLSWVEQRSFSDLTLAALETHPVVSELKQNLDNLKPQKPNLTDYVKTEDRDFKCLNGSASLGFNSDGSLRALNYKGETWASDSNRLAKFTYVTYNQTDYDLLARTYNWQWPNHDRVIPYYKINVTQYAHPKSQEWITEMTDLYQKKDKSCDFLARVKMADKESYIYYGAPEEVWLHYTEYNKCSESGLDVTLLWFNKTSTRLPEALMLTFQPDPHKGHHWLVSKMGELVDPTNVVLNGSQRQHVVDDSGVFYIEPDSGTGLQLVSLDVPVACPIISGKATVFPYLQPLLTSDSMQGMAFNFYNNIWDTNYIFWYPYLKGDEDFKARFSIMFVEKNSDFSKRLMKINNRH